MAVERPTAGASLIDVLDRVLDKGIVIDAWVRVSLVGIDLITVEARVVVASIETYFKYSELLAQRTPRTLTVKTGKFIGTRASENALGSLALARPAEPVGTRT
jgi:hypothetical protein